jgi:hypothetical protein
MAGTNGQEGRVFVIGQNNVTAFLQSIIGNYPALETAITKAYPIGAFGTTNDYEVIFTDIYRFTCYLCKRALILVESLLSPL